MRKKNCAGGVLLAGVLLDVMWVNRNFVFMCRQDWKLDTLCDLYETLTITQAVIFCNTRRKVDWLTDKMHTRDFTVSAMVCIKLFDLYIECWVVAKHLPCLDIKITEGCPERIQFFRDCTMGGIKLQPTFCKTRLFLKLWPLFHFHK